LSGVRRRIFETILIPIDGEHLEAIDMGLKLAEDYNATVHGLYVDTASNVITAASSPAPLWGSSTNSQLKGEQALDELRTRKSDNIPTQTSMKTGDPAAKTCMYVKNHGIDLIVVHREQKSQLRLIGSISDKLVRTADIPVFVVPAQNS
jgi:nucleotide-binding universal stress UspA family protein